METETVNWTRKHLIGLEDLSRQEIELILSMARSFKSTIDRSRKKLPALRGKTIVNLFLEPSTRTRVAFEVSAKRLSADVITILGATSSQVKGETLKDTALNIEALSADMIIMRHSAAGAPLYLSRIVDIPIINAGDGAHE
ncbi:MAG TPA: aspartate carbamoyltransferase, partial [Opitutales bacterium]|nr:aspartate carbamoyltransferase [Opitutales bacterium]